MALHNMKGKFISFEGKRNGLPLCSSFDTWTRTHALPYSSLMSLTSCPIAGTVLL